MFEKGKNYVHKKLIDTYIKVIYVKEDSGGSLLDIYWMGQKEKWCFYWDKIEIKKKDYENWSEYVVDKG